MDGSDLYVNQNNYVDGDDKPTGAFIGQQLLATNGNAWEWSGTDWYQVKAAGLLTSKSSLNPDTATHDAFARLRVSNPETIFDSKQIHDNQPLFWDDQEVSGGSTTSAWTQAHASTVIGVGAATAGKRIRQTFRRFNYQPAKSQLFFMTGTLGAVGGGSGITRSMGVFDDNNGLFARDNEGIVELVCRSSYTGAPVDTAIAQSSWNLDTFDGNGSSGITLDGSKSQILIADFEWLGVGRVRMGFVVNGIPIYCHEFNHANINAGVYMSTPNLPLRYEIENDGTGAASSLEHICSSVISEGGIHETGINHHENTENTFINANSTTAVYAVFGLRLAATNLDATIKLVSQSIMNATADDYIWTIRHNPTLAGAGPAWTTDGATQWAKGDVVGSPSVNTVTNGHIVAGGYVKSGGSSGAVSEVFDSTLLLGSAIDGTRDEQWLCVQPLSTNADIYGGLSWRQVS